MLFSRGCVIMLCNLENVLIGPELYNVNLCHYTLGYFVFEQALDICLIDLSVKLRLLIDTSAIKLSKFGWH